MLKKIFISFVLCLVLGMPALSQERLFVDNLQIPRGYQTMMKVSFQFSEPHDYVSYQFTVNLPEGVSLKSSANGKVPVVLGDGQPNDLFVLDMNATSRIVTCYSNPSTPISLNEGILVYIPVIADKALQAGTTLNGSLSSIQLAHADASPANLGDVSFAITIDDRAVLDEQSTTIPAPAEGVDVQVKRTIKANQWSTICLPFAMTEQQTKDAFGSEVQIADFNDYVYDGVNNTIQVLFQPVTAMEANHPYIIKVTDAVADFIADGVDINPQEAIVDFDTSRRKNQPRQFVGTYVAGTVLGWGTLFLSDNRFWYSTGQTKMKAFRGYFNFNDLIADFEQNYESRIVMFVGDETTSIGDASRLNDKCKMINEMYDLQGRRVNNPQQGVYIRNGKKVVVTSN